MNIPQVTELELLGQRFKLKTSHSETDHAARVSAFVKNRLDEAQAKFKGIHPPHVIAIHAYFELAEEYLRAQTRVSEHQAEMKSAIESIL